HHAQRHPEGHRRRQPARRAGELPPRLDRARRQPGRTGRAREPAAAARADGQRPARAPHRGGRLRPPESQQARADRARPPEPGAPGPLPHPRLGRVPDAQVGPESRAMKSTNASRRVFLRASSLLGALVPSAAPFALNLAAMGTAAAQSATDYRALVCLFMFGGNDSGNMVVATDPSSWSEYTRLRTGSMQLGAPGGENGLLPISPATAQAGRSFALHPAMVDAKASFDAGRHARVANVGPLDVPTARAQYRERSVPLAPNLFSHSDQQSTWQTHLPEAAQYGWGGRMGDLLASMNSTQSFTCISASGNAVWLSGEGTVQFRVGANGSSAIGGLEGTLFGSSRGPDDLRYLLTRSHANLLEESHAAVTRRSLAAQALLDASMLPADAVD